MKDTFALAACRLVVEGKWRKKLGLDTADYSGRIISGETRRVSLRVLSSIAESGLQPLEFRDAEF